MLYQGIAGALLLIGAGVFYYLVIFLPHESTLKAQQDKAALQQQAAAQERQQAADQQHKTDEATNLQTCLDTVQRTYLDDWSRACADYGISDKGPLCSLPSHQATVIENYRTQSKADCFKQYPQN